MTWSGMTSRDEQLSDDEEIARRRDEVIRRMANTPPQPKPKRAADASPEKSEGTNRKTRSRLLKSVEK